MDPQKNNVPRNNEASGGATRGGLHYYFRERRENGVMKRFFNTGPAKVLQGVVFRRSKRPLDVPVDQNRARKWNLHVILGLERSSGMLFR